MKIKRPDFGKGLEFHSRSEKSRVRVVHALANMGNLIIDQRRTHVRRDPNAEILADEATVEIGQARRGKVFYKVFPYIQKPQSGNTLNWENATL